MASTAPAKMPEWPADKVERWPLDRLKPNPRNAREHSEEQVEQIGQLMEEFGWTVPILASEAEVIIAGHGRYAAAKMLGYTEAPVIVARGWTDEQIAAYALADNQVALRSTWNTELLAEELRDLDAEGFDMGLLGFGADELKAALDGAAGDEGDGESGGGEIEDPPDDRYTEQYGVIVLCQSEAEQAKVYEQLKGDGFSCRVVTT